MKWKSKKKFLEEISSTSDKMFKKGPWTASEDAILVAYVNEHGEGNWNSVQRRSGLCRCGKSCRLRWANHLRPNLKKGAFTPDEERMIFDLHAKLGNKWARMATVMPGRTDNEIKNYWNTRIKRRMRAGISPYPHETCGSLNHCLPKFEQGVYNSNKKEQSCSLLKNTSLGISTQWPGRMNGRAKNIADDDAVYDFEGFCAVMEVGNAGMNNNGGCSSAASSVAVTSSGGLRSELPSSQVIVSLDNPSEPDFSFHLLSEADNSSFVNTNSGLLDSLLYNQHDNIMYAAKEDAENIKTGIVDVAPDYVITTAITRVDVPIEMVNNSEQNQWESLLQVSNTQIKGEANADYTDHEISTVIGFAKPDELSTMLDLEKPDPVILSEWYTTSATNNNTTPIGEDCTVPTAAMENTQEGLQDSIIYNMVNNHQYIMWGDMGSCSCNNMHYLLKVEIPSKYRLGF